MGPGSQQEGDKTMPKPYCIILHFTGDEWQYKTIGPRGAIVNFGCGYPEPEHALVQAKIFFDPDAEPIPVSAVTLMLPTAKE